MTTPTGTTSRTSTRRFHLLFGFGLGVLLGTAMGIGEDSVVQGLVGFAIVFGWSAFTCFVPRNRFELLRVGEPNDERQSKLLSEASEVSGYAVITFALAGATWDMAHGRFGDFAWVCVVGGASFILASIILPRRR